jgi:hypothetical protein
MHRSVGGRRGPRWQHSSLCACAECSTRNRTFLLNPKKKFDFSIFSNLTHPQSHDKTGKSGRIGDVVKPIALERQETKIKGFGDLVSNGFHGLCKFCGLFLVLAAVSGTAQALPPPTPEIDPNTMSGAWQVASTCSAGHAAENSSARYFWRQSLCSADTGFGMSLSSFPRRSD